ncbi:hypothetical protein [Candidatus Magnetobacterium casense]|uniref:Secreted protein n=1 Tax=Candidatus Magnetobacterium casense TaxID=1455061 RepID=A0ABS6S1I0_9BACT|nr:hypothetical protein [Candidatus Magnetobacterium casensis]MBV6342705.1 hypothetical protein [Candidatus Magnetobacterium casensis]
MKRVWMSVSMSFALMFLLAGVSFGASITGEVMFINKENGAFSVKSKDVELSFNTSTSMIRDFNAGDVVNVDYAIESDHTKVLSVSANIITRYIRSFTSDELGRKSDMRQIYGQVVSVDGAKGFLVVKADGIEAPFKCPKSMLSGVEVDNTVNVNYVVENGKARVSNISVKKDTALVY